MYYYIDANVVSNTPRQPIYFFQQVLSCLWRTHDLPITDP